MLSYFSTARFFIVFVFFFSSVVFAGEARISNEFKNTMNYLDDNPDNVLEATINGATGWKFLYTSETSDVYTGFGQFGQVDDLGSIYISLAPINEVNAVGYQCVGFVKSASLDLRNTGTSQWMRGERVTSSVLPTSGTIIATFDSFGNYDHGHVAVYIAKIGNYIYVLDQNWDGTGSNPVGKIYLHAIPFSGNGGVNDANSYYRVEI